MDVLQDHLARARASGGVFARSVAQPPWGLRLPGTIMDVPPGAASENNQRGFYTRWRQFMEAASWKGLAS